VINTVIYTLCSVFLQLPLALGLAILLNQKWLKGHSFLRLAFYSPNLMGTVYVGILFQQLFTVHYGLVNRVLASIIPGFSPDTKWLGDPHYVMPALVLTSLWLYVGYNMIYFLAGLQSVDKELYEAAEVDGANAWQRFWAVTVPSIKPIITFVLVTSTIGSFQLFDLPYIMLSNSGGPNNAGLTMVMYLYQQGFTIGDLGYASAVGWTLALGVLVISLVQMRLTGTWKGNEA
jgi:ABC-type sugar transport system permease subunit